MVDEVGPKVGSDLVPRGEKEVERLVGSRVGVAVAFVAVNMPEVPPFCVSYLMNIRHQFCGFVGVGVGDEEEVGGGRVEPSEVPP